jgi:immune inhibitor A
MSNLIKTLPIALGLVSSLALAAPSIPVQDLKAPKDPGVINKERIEYWMKVRGQIDDSMSKQEIELRVNQYASRAHTGVLPKFPKVVLKPSTKQVQSLNAEGNMMTKTVNVLSVLIDFPDLKNDDNGLSSSDTSMYYSSYPVSHYQALQFSPTGFDGPSGQNLLSGHQYYQAESGGTFFFSGTTYGWVRADNNHDYYGGNDADNDDNDKNPGELVTEAVNKAFANNTIDLSEFDIEDQYDIDGDGNVNEPDGLIDHVMIYHSSVGEEAGGGVAGNNGDDAIWSHRFFVNPTGQIATLGANITGSEYQPGVP